MRWRRADDCAHQFSVGLNRVVDQNASGVPMIVADRIGATGVGAGGTDTLDVPVGRTLSAGRRDDGSDEENAEGDEGGGEVNHRFALASCIFTIFS